jgi:hypothetical protein
MGTPFIVVWHPLVQETSQVRLGERDQKIQAFPPQRADEPLADRVGLRALRRCGQEPQSKMARLLIELWGKDAVPIMDQEAIAVVSWDRVA